MKISDMTSAEQRVFCERAWNGPLLQVVHLNYFNNKGISCKGRAAKDELLVKRRAKFEKRGRDYLKKKKQILIA